MKGVFKYSFEILGLIIVAVWLIFLVQLLQRSQFVTWNNFYLLSGVLVVLLVLGLVRIKYLLKKM